MRLDRFNALLLLTYLNIMFRTLVVTCFLFVASLSQAHMVWLDVNEEAYPQLFFGESPADRDYHLPDAIAEATVTQTNIDAPAKTLPMDKHEEEGFVGLESEDPIEPRGVIRCAVQYGIYGGSLLSYDAQCYPAADASSWPTEAAKDQALQAILKLHGNQLQVTVLKNGEPAAEASIARNHKDLDEPQRVSTNAEGVATFELSDSDGGLNGLLLMLVDDDNEGNFHGDEYSSTTNILTVTFTYDPESYTKVSSLPALPNAIASFGAVVEGDWLYVYSGHIGQAHDHSKDNLSSHFSRINLTAPAAWEELECPQPLQGMPLVSYQGKVYRVGGLNALNASGEEEILKSVDTFACYDPEAKEWSAMPSLPNGRSSHNAVVIGDQLYVVGGWQLDGDDDGEWQPGALRFDLSDPNAQWEELAEPDFKRRALAVGRYHGKLAVLGGMTDDQEISKNLFLYDPQTKAWTEGADFPGMPFHCFGLSAWNEAGELYACGMAGVVYKYVEADGDEEAKWEEVSKLATKRFFHQLVPNGKGGLLVVGGVSPSEGHLTSTEEITLSTNE